MIPVRTRMPHVALFLPTSIKACRDILRGVLKFVQCHGPWAVHLIAEHKSKHTPFDPVAWGCTGMIVDMRDRAQADRLLAARIPVVLSHVPDALLSASHPLARMCRLQCENAPIGVKAAEHLLERRYRHYAYVGLEVNGVSWSDLRRASFCQRLAQDGFTCMNYPGLPRAERGDYSKDQAQLCAWLNELPKPVALFAANDARARQVLDSCLKAGLAVPQEIAVLGVDNDELICETAHPQLSSIQMSTEQAGFEAARTLDRMMRAPAHGKQLQTIITFGFSHLVTRSSTETVQIADPLVARAIEFIRINAGIVVTVEDLVQHLHVSRRWLEKRFKSVMGRTVYAEIQHNRLTRVQTLLRESSLPIDEIAADCGFASASHLGTLFRQHFDTTPAAYRRSQKCNAQGRSA